VRRSRLRAWQMITVPGDHQVELHPPHLPSSREATSAARADHHSIDVLTRFPRIFWPLVTQQRYSFQTKVRAREKHLHRGKLGTRQGLPKETTLPHALGPLAGLRAPWGSVTDRLAVLAACRKTPEARSTALVRNFDQHRTLTTSTHRPA
jgi:hypothetical protein